MDAAVAAAPCRRMNPARNVRKPRAYLGVRADCSRWKSSPQTCRGAGHVAARHAQPRRQCRDQWSCLSERRRLCSSLQRQEQWDLGRRAARHRSVTL